MGFDVILMQIESLRSGDKPVLSRRKSSTFMSVPGGGAIGNHVTFRVLQGVEHYPIVLVKSYAFLANFSFLPTLTIVAYTKFPSDYQ